MKCKATNWVSMKIEGGTRGKMLDAWQAVGAPFTPVLCRVKLLVYKLSECLILTSFFLILDLTVAHTLWAVNQYSWNELISK